MMKKTFVCDTRAIYSIIGLLHAKKSYLLGQCTLEVVYRNHVILTDYENQAERDATFNAICGLLAVTANEKVSPKKIADASL